MKITDFFKRFWRNKFVKAIIYLVLMLILCTAVFVGVFVGKCSSVQTDFKPINEPLPQEQLAIEQKIAGYSRTEVTTYLTFPEWYLVFNPQEYAEFLKNNLPSRFPYFTSIWQSWHGYCQVYGITKKNYEFNADNHLVEAVIVTSASIEFFAKGVYENTVGRASEILAGGQQVEEDFYAAKVAKDYGDFIPTDPWYAFPFGRALIGLWSDTSLWGPHFIRKWERKLALSFEYGVKYVYAKVIGFGTHAKFGVADTEIYAHVGGVSNEVFNNPKVKKVQEVPGGTYIVTVPHYQGFTDTVPGLAEEGIQFLDLAGNDEILLTVVAPASWKYDLTYGAELFTMPILTDAGLKRVAIQVPVRNLREILNQAKTEGIKIEHLFDY